MTYNELISHFEGLSEAARALGVDRRLVDRWKRRRIPSKHQLKAERKSSGKLKADAQATADAEEMASYVRSSRRRASRAASKEVRP